MKILALNFNIINNSKNQTHPAIKPNFNYALDKINFTSKAPEENSLYQEAKDLSKEAYSVFSRGKEIQKQGNNHLKNASQIQNQAQQIYKKYQKEFRELSHLLDEVEEHKIVATAEPNSNIQRIFKASKKSITMEEYKNNTLVKKAIKTDDALTIFEYGKDKKVKKSVFDFKKNTFEHHKNCKMPTSNAFTSEVSYIFENGSLKSCDFGVSKSPKATDIAKRYSFSDGKLNYVEINFSQNKDNSTKIAQQYRFNDNNLISYCKDYQKDNMNKNTIKEIYDFSQNEVKYITNLTSVPNKYTKADKVFSFVNSSLKRAIIGLHNDFSTRTAKKYFLYNKNEKPQRCYINHSYDDCQSFDFKDDFADSYEKVVYFN